MLERLSTPGRVVGLLFTAVIFCAAAAGTTLSVDKSWGKCVGVTDGDTISVMHNGRAVKVRLEGIDCPETGHDFSNTAKKFTSALVYGRTVEVHQTDTDGYGRILGVVFADGFESGDATKWSSTVP